MPVLNFPLLVSDTTVLTLSAEIELTNTNDNHETWIKMESDLLEFFNEENVLKKVSLDQNKCNTKSSAVCAIGGISSLPHHLFQESIFLHIQLYNPLSIAIHLGNIQPCFENSSHLLCDTSGVSECKMNPMESLNVRSFRSFRFPIVRLNSNLFPK